MGREKVFKFKRFAVVNDRSAMKVGTDGVLLGAWCPVDGAKRVLDVGTGCGVIALMVSQRNPTATIVGIDIDHDAIEEATANFGHSPWSERLTAIEGDFNEWTTDEGFDLIVSNPPTSPTACCPRETAAPRPATPPRSPIANSSREQADYWRQTASSHSSRRPTPRATSSRRPRLPHCR